MALSLHLRKSSKLKGSSSVWNCLVVEPEDASWAKSLRPWLETWDTVLRIRNLSYKASNSSLSGSSFEAPTMQSRGTSILSAPLSNSLSFSKVSKALRIAELALKISSTKATWAVGRYPSIWRWYLSSSRPFMLSGPKSSSGTENLVSRRSK